MLSAVSTEPLPVVAQARPRLGFVGVGWIGRARMKALVDDGGADVVVIADPAPDELAAARALVPHASVAHDLDALLEQDIDAVVIATPNALHVEHTMQALQAGKAVFCQKPLARTAAEVQRIGAAARAVDRLVGVDFSYRHSSGVQAIRQLVQQGRLGKVYAVDLVFHNAWGPDKAWFRDARLAGGGCMLDLGIHLIDLALWMLDFPVVERVQARLYRAGHLLSSAEAENTVEDHAVAQLDLHGGLLVRIACSWNLSAGQDAVIEARFHGTDAGAAWRNVGGSYYDFVAEAYDGTRCSVLASPPDAWGGRALGAWARQLTIDPRFDTSFDRIATVAQVVDRIYAR